MPYSRSLNKVVITPPKTGSRTIEAVMCEIDGVTKAELLFHGHIPYGRMKKLLDEKNIECEHWAMPVRDPIERVFSIVNYHAQNRKKKSLDEIMKQVISCAERKYPPQKRYWHESIELVPFEGMKILDWLGWDGKVPRINKSFYRFSRDKIRTHKRFEELLGIYREDYELREMIC